MFFQKVFRVNGTVSAFQNNPSIWPLARLWHLGQKQDVYEPGPRGPPGAGPTTGSTSGLHAAAQAAAWSDSMQLPQAGARGREGRRKPPRSLPWPPSGTRHSEAW